MATHQVVVEVVGPEPRAEIDAFARLHQLVILIGRKRLESPDEIRQVFLLVVTVNLQDDMNVIGHHHRRINVKLRKDPPQPQQILANHFAQRIQDQLLVGNYPEHRLVHRHLKSDEEPALEVVDVRVSQRIHGNSISHNQFG